MGFKAWIWALRLNLVEFGRIGIRAFGLRFGPQDWDLGFETGIWASRLGFEGGDEEREEGEGEEENSPV